MRHRATPRFWFCYRGLPETFNVDKRAPAFLLGRFSSRVLKTDEHLIPEAAIEALEGEGISFTVKKDDYHVDSSAEV